MRLTELKQHLNEVETLQLSLPGGATVPPHFHITEAGLVSRSSIDCGGKLHTDRRAFFQIWYSDDTGHRLTPAKLLSIVRTWERLFGKENPVVELEYQTDTTGRYGLNFDRASGRFLLTTIETDCPTSDCIIAPEREVHHDTTEAEICRPGGGCC